MVLSPFVPLHVKCSKDKQLVIQSAAQHTILDGGCGLLCKSNGTPAKITFFSADSSCLEQNRLQMIAVNENEIERDLTTKLVTGRNDHLPQNLNLKLTFHKQKSRIAFQATRLSHCATRDL
jgi:hypothetical protein